MEEEEKEEEEEATANGETRVHHQVTA